MKQRVLIVITWLLLIGAVRATIDIDGIWTGEDDGNISFQHVACLPSASLNSQFVTLQAPAVFRVLSKPFKAIVPLFVPAALQSGSFHSSRFAIALLLSRNSVFKPFLISGLQQGRSPPLLS
jgi:hypothetical protein